MFPINNVINRGLVPGKSFRTAKRPADEKNNANKINKYRQRKCNVNLSRVRLTIIIMEKK